MATGGSDDNNGEKKFPPHSPKVVNHFYIDKFNGLITFGTSAGNTINYGPEVRIKLDGPPELHAQMNSVIDENGQNSSISIQELLQRCDCNLLRVRKGCVELTLRVGSQAGLEELLQMCNSGKLERLLGTEFPVNGLRLVEEDIALAHRFFEEEKVKKNNELKKELENFEKAATEYGRRRAKTVELLGELVGYITRRQRQAQAAAAVGAAGVGLALFTLGASTLVSAAAAGVTVGLVAVIVQGVTAKISTDEAKMIMAKDQAACERVQTTLEAIEPKLLARKGKGERLLINSIHDLVKVDRVNLKRGEDAIETIEGQGRGEFIQIVVLAVKLDAIILYILDMFSFDISKMAKAIKDIADKLEGPNEAAMRGLVSEIKARLELDDN